MAYNHILDRPWNIDFFGFFPDFYQNGTLDWWLARRPRPRFGWRIRASPSKFVTTGDQNRKSWGHYTNRWILKAVDFQSIRGRMMSVNSSNQLKKYWLDWFRSIIGSKRWFPSQGRPFHAQFRRAALKLVLTNLFSLDRQGKTDFAPSLFSLVSQLILLCLTEINQFELLEQISFLEVKRSEAV